ncbi:MAG: hypothetical protein GY841_04795 [FCB group bacterium]|nr:hypothetical protein [FCB group bacterium]
MSYRLVTFIFILVLCIALINPGFAGDEGIVDRESKSETQSKATDSRSGEEINWQVISCGGSLNGESTDFLLSSTLGQTAVGTGNADGIVLNHGFWQEFMGSCCNSAGDANDDGAINVGDAVYMINYVFKGGPAPNCGDEGDANSDCALNVGDAVFLINYVFKSGPPPECGCVG